MRLALEQMEPEKEMENFVRDYSTGNAIPEPPTFINYANTDAPPVNHNRIVTRPALFARTSQRPPKSGAVSPLDEGSPFDIAGTANHAGVGAGGGPSMEGSTMSRSGTQKSQSGRSYANGVNGHVSPPLRDGQPQLIQIPTQPPSVQTQTQAPAPQRRNSAASMLMRTSQPPSHRHSRSIHSQSHGPAYGPDPVDPSVSSTQLVIGNRAWDVDPSKDPQLQQSRPGANGSVGQGPAPSRTSPPVTAGEDPLVKQMAELSTAAAASGSTGRRNTIVRRDVPPLSSPLGTSSRASPPGAGVVWSNDKGETLAMPASGPSSTRDFRNSAEIVVGGYPLAPSRSASPNPVPPRAALAAPPSRADSSSSPSSVSYPAASNIPVEQIVTNYQRPFPGEPGRSRANSIVGQPPLNPPPSSSTSALIAGGGQGLTHSPIQQQEPGTRPTSRAGYPGIGTTSLVGRAPSPVRPTSAGAGAMQPYNRAGPVVAAAAAAGNGGQQHSVAPSNPVGIALGPDGRVVHDQMAVQQRHPLHRPSSSTGGQVQTQGYPPGPGPALTNHQMYGGGAGAGYGDGRMGQVPPPSQPPSRNDYYGAVVPSSAQGHGAYGHPTHYDTHPSQYNAPPPPSSYGGNSGYGPPARHPSVSGGGAGAYGGGQYQQQQPPQNYHPQHQIVHGNNQPQQQQLQMRYYGGGGNNGNNGAGFRAPSPAVARSPSPQPPRGQHPPTCSYTDDGKPILFYGTSYPFLDRFRILSDGVLGSLLLSTAVKALYDYTATIDEEFDFQSGDIIAVTDTPEDGWWSGELLDEARKQPGRHVFPSNFVCLF